MKIPIRRNTLLTAKSIGISYNRLVRFSSSQNGFHGLKISCDCSKASIIASGPSFYNYFCHSEATRKVSGSDYIPISAFKPYQVNFQPNKDSFSFVPDPKNPSVHHIHCNCCAKKSYLGSDLTNSLGLLAINTVATKNLPVEYQPNHHFHYSERKTDVKDNIPKWKRLIDGELEVKGTVSSPSSNEGHSFVLNNFEKALTPLIPPEPKEYIFTELEFPINNTTKVTEEKILERVSKKYILPNQSAYVAPKKNKRDVIIVGGGHNALISAAYLAKEGVDVLVLERRHTVGGAAVTEEMVPGFKFSRASYLAGLLRPHIISDLSLEKYGFKYLTRNPSSFTPTKLDSIYQGKYLLLGASEKEDYQSIAQFSQKDADNYLRYEEFLNSVREIMQPLLDSPPITIADRNLRVSLQQLSSLEKLMTATIKNKDVILPFYELFTGPAQQILDRWFESDILKTTLATDAVIGASISPKHNGSAYVLLHHVMGEAAGKKGVWAYVEGGMGAITQAIAASARDKGAEILTNAMVKRLLHDGKTVRGVEMFDGSVIEAETVLSGTTPYHTFVELMPEWTNGYQNKELEKYTHHIRHLDFSCGAFKINCAVDKLPNFTCYPSPTDGTPGPMHRGTVHFESHMDEIEFAYREASHGIPATRPVVEMTIPSSIDTTLAPPGKHVVQFFIQYAPYDVNPKIGSWADPVFKDSFVQRCFKIVDEFAPGFSSSVLGYDALSPLDLERVFGLHRGSISHGALSLHQLSYARPMPGYSSYRTPIDGLYLCSAGTHPGGGVIGAGGHNCAKIVLADLQKKKYGI